MRAIKNITLYIVLGALTLTSVAPADQPPEGQLSVQPKTWTKTKVTGGFMLGAGLSGLATYLVTRMIYAYRLKKARDDLMIEQRVNSAGVQHDLDLQRKKIKELNQTIMTLSEALGRRSAGVALPHQQRAVVSAKTADKVTEQANQALVDLQFKELATRNK